MMNTDYLQPFIDEQPYPLMFLCISGAHLYGFPSPDSDVDVRGVHLLPLRDVIGFHALKESIHTTRMIDGVEVDYVTHDLLSFLINLWKKSGNFLEQVYAPLIIQTSPEHEMLKDIAHQTITVHHSHHYFGFSRRKWGEFSEQQPTAKRLLYVYRVLLTGIHLMNTGRVESNLVNLNDVFKLPYIPDLIERKLTGTEHGILENADVEFHTKEYHRLVKMLEDARDASTLPDHPGGKDALHDFLVQVRLKQV